MGNNLPEPKVGPPLREDLLLKMSLYDVVPETGNWSQYVQTLRWGSFQFDAHCKWCNQASTFKSAFSSYKGSLADAVKLGFFSRAVHCSRDEKHTYSYEFLLSNEGLQKVGQFPSLEDIVGSDLKRYAAVIDKEDYRELRRATGLFSHGIGIGSFVYLRRIFERMIYRHRDQVEKDSAPITNFDKMRMVEKIGALSSVLPPSLVKNKAVYSILSTGIHELSEDDCRKYFPVVRAAIIQILEQDLEARQRQQAERELELEVARINGEIS